LTCQRSVANAGAGGQEQGANALLREYAKSVVSPSLLAGVGRVEASGNRKVLKPSPKFRSLNCLVRGADALHLAEATRSKITHFASLDKTQRIAAGHWLRGIECAPGA
jgi:hypothetical protein